MRGEGELRSVRIRTPLAAEKQPGRLAFLLLAAPPAVDSPPGLPSPSALTLPSSPCGSGVVGPVAGGAWRELNDHGIRHAEPEVASGGLDSTVCEGELR